MLILLFKARDLVGANIANRSVPCGGREGWNPRQKALTRPYQLVNPVEIESWLVAPAML